MTSNGEPDSHATRCLHHNQGQYGLSETGSGRPHEHSDPGARENACGGRHDDDGNQVQLCALRRSLLYRASVAIGKPAGKDDNEIDKRPNLKTAQGNQLEQPGASLAKMKAVRTEEPERPAQQQCGEPGVRRDVSGHGGLLSRSQTDGLPSTTAPSASGAC